MFYNYGNEAHETFTELECKILKCLKEGLQRKEIIEKLNISDYFFNIYIHNISCKLKRREQ